MKLKSANVRYIITRIILHTYFLLYSDYALIFYYPITTSRSGPHASTRGANGTLDSCSVLACNLNKIYNFLYGSSFRPRPAGVDHASNTHVILISKEILASYILGLSFTEVGAEIMVALCIILAYGWRLRWLLWNL